MKPLTHACIRVAWKQDSGSNCNLITVNCTRCLKMVVYRVDVANLSQLNSSSCMQHFGFRRRRMKNTQRVRKWHTWKLCTYTCSLYKQRCTHCHAKVYTHSSQKSCRECSKQSKALMCWCLGGDCRGLVHTECITIHDCWQLLICIQVTVAINTAKL